MERNKALLKIGKETFLQCLVRRARVHGFSDIALLSNGRALPTGIQAYHDAISDCGPLGGLLTAMHVSPNPSFATVTVDAPMISDRLIRVLVSFKLKDGMDAAVVKSPDSIHPLTGIFRSRIKDRLTKRLRREECKVLDFIHSLRIETIHCGEDEIRNINTPEEYRQFLWQTQQD
jgi:molybdenum cofactor guanylyltransferase